MQSFFFVSIALLKEKATQQKGQGFSRSQGKYSLLKIFFHLIVIGAEWERNKIEDVSFF
jgi:hypothetical protein